MREVIIGAVSAFVVAVVTITFMGPKSDPPVPMPAPQQQAMPFNKKMDFGQFRQKDRPFMRRNAILAASVDAGVQ